MIYLIIWWLIGVISYNLGCVILDKELSPKNIFQSTYLGVTGLFIPIYIISELIKKHKIPQRYKDKWNENLLNKKL